MQQNITYNDLILFAFNETELEKTVAVTRAMESNPNLEEKYNEFSEIITSLQSAQAEPSETLIRAIVSNT